VTDEFPSDLEKSQGFLRVSTEKYLFNHDIEKVSPPISHVYVYLLRFLNRIKQHTFSNFRN